MKDLLEYILKSLVTKPDKIKIEEIRDGSSVNLNFSVDPEDMGITIGKGGQTIQAARKLLIARAMAENQGLKVYLNLEEAK